MDYVRSQGVSHQLLSQAFPYSGLLYSSSSPIPCASIFLEGQRQSLWNNLYCGGKAGPGQLAWLCYLLPAHAQGTDVLAQCLPPFYLVIYCLLWNPHHCVLASFQDTDHSLLCLWCHVLVWVCCVLCPHAPGYHAILSVTAGTDPSACPISLSECSSQFIY